MAQRKTKQDQAGQSDAEQADEVDEDTRRSMEQAARNAGTGVPTTSGDYDPDQ